MKKIYFALLVAALAFSGHMKAQDVQWLASSTINYTLNPSLTQQPACASANRIYAARMVDFALNYNELFGSFAIDCYDPSGALMWSFPVGDSVDVESISSDASGNVIVGGEYMSTMNLGASDSLANTNMGLYNVNLFLFSLDDAGNLNWKRNITLTHPDAWELSVVETDHLGNFWYGLSYFDSISIKRLDSNGSDVQSHLIEGTRSMKSFSFDPMGNLYVTGSSGSLTMNIKNTSVNVPEPYMMFVTRIDAAGNCNWIKLAHDVTFNSPHIVAANNGDAYLAGNLMDSTAFGTVIFHHPEWVYDIFLTRLDSSGNFSWGVQVPHQQTLTGDFYRGTNNFIDVDASGNVYMTGTIRGLVDWGNGVISDAGQIPSNGVSVVSFDASGIPRWQISGTGPGFITPYSILSPGIDECYFTSAAVGPLTMDSISTNPGNDLAFILGKISSSTAINEMDVKENLVLFPNPVDDKLYVGSLTPKGGMAADAEISIYNSLGENLFSDDFISTSTNHFEIEVSKFPEGIYFLSIGDVKKKFVVQHK
jgi:hypothetical protein